MGSKATVSGDGVMIYNAGSKFPKTGGFFGAINLSGNAVVTLSPPQTGCYAGIGLFQARDNTVDITVSGNASLTLQVRSATRRRPSSRKATTPA